MIVIRQIATVEELYQKRGARTGEVIVDAVVDMLMHGRRTNTLKDFAAVIGLDQRTLSKVIEKLVGIKLKEMIMQWRMMQALDMLDDHTISFEEVAHECGFSTTKELGKEFSRRMHTTIGAYRSCTVRRNSNYGFNQRAEKRKEVTENASKLRNRKKNVED